MGHPADHDLIALLNGGLKPAARRRVVRHLLSGCEACTERLRAVAPPEMLWSTSQAAPEDAYDACFDRALEAVQPWEARRWEEEERCERALALVRSQGWGKLTRAKRRALRGTWAYIEMLLQLSFEARYRDPKEMLHFADSALLELDRLDPTVYGAVHLCDLRARVWAEVANACRVNEIFARAVLALGYARSFLEQGTGDLRVQVRIDDVEASLCNMERRLAEAQVLLDRVHRVYSSLGERHLAGRALVKKGINWFLRGEPLEAVQVLRRALTFLDPARDPQLAANAQHNLLFALADAGKYREAGQLLLKSGIRRAFANDPLNLLRLRWVEAKILAGRGRLAEAERVFGEVRAGFSGRGLCFVAAIAGLDEARMLLRQGKTGQLRELARQLHQSSRDRKILPQARYALLSFEVACRYGYVTADMADRVGRFLEQLQHAPWLEWQPELLVVG